MKLQGFIKLIVDKTLITYNDGIFAWSCEGGFYQFLKEDRNDLISIILKKIYYADGQFYSLFTMVMQFIWLICLFSIWIGIKKIVKR